MNTLADAIITAITYISTAAADDERADGDVKTLESLVTLLRQGSAEELSALREALQRARSRSELSPNPHLDLINTFNAIETDIPDA